MADKIDSWFVQLNSKITKFFGDRSTSSDEFHLLSMDINEHDAESEFQAQKYSSNAEVDMHFEEVMDTHDHDIEFTNLQRPQSEDKSLGDHYSKDEIDSDSEEQDGILRGVPEANEQCNLHASVSQSSGEAKEINVDESGVIDLVNRFKNAKESIEEVIQKIDDQPVDLSDVVSSIQDEIKKSGVIEASFKNVVEAKSLGNKIEIPNSDSSKFAVHLGYGSQNHSSEANCVIEDEIGALSLKSLGYEAVSLSEFDFESTGVEDLLLIRASREVCRNMASMMSLFEQRFFKQLSDDERQRLFRLAQIKSKRLFNAFSALEEIITRQKKGVTPLARNSLRLNRLLDEINVKYQSISIERGIEFLISLEGDIPSRMATDPQRVYRILDYLIDNAFTFTQDGRISLRVMYKDDTLVMFVNDTGSGMNAEILQQLKNLENLDDLGNLISEQVFPPTIALVYCLVRDLSGELEVSSIEKVGTCFSLKIPTKGIGNELALWEATSIDPFDSKEFFRFNFVRNLSGNLLVVSNDGFLIESVRYFTKVSKIKLTIVEDTERMLRRIAGSSIDLAMIDINSVVFDEERLKQRIEAYKLKVPIVGLTANSEPLSFERSNGLFFSYLQLPLRAHKLFAILCNYLNLDGAMPEQFVNHFRNRDTGYVLCDTLVDFASELLFDFEVVKKQLSKGKFSEASLKLSSLIRLVEHYELFDLVDLFEKLRQAMADESRSEGLIIKIDWVLDEILRQEDTSEDVAPKKEMPSKKITPKPAKQKNFVSNKPQKSISLEVEQFANIEVPDDIKPLVADFVKEVDLMVEKIRKSVTSGVLSNACELAQELLGAASLYGFTELSSILRSLLMDLEQQDTTRVPDRLELVKKFKIKLERVVNGH